MRTQKSASSSLSFSAAADALIRLDVEDSAGLAPSEEPEVARRLSAIQTALVLHRRLELELAIPHRQTLLAMVCLARDLGRCSVGEAESMKRIGAAANAARHRAWTILLACGGAPLPSEACGCVAVLLPLLVAVLLPLRRSGLVHLGLPGVFHLLGMLRSWSTHRTIFLVGCARGCSLSRSANSIKS